MNRAALLLFSFLLVTVAGGALYISHQAAVIRTLSSDLQSARRSVSALEQTVNASRHTDTVVADWAGWAQAVTATTPEVITILSEVRYVAPFDFDAPVDDSVFLPLCLRVYQTDRVCFYEPADAACTLTGPGFDPLARCKGEARQSWRGLVQWVAKLIDRVALERGDKYALRQWAASLTGKTGVQ